MAEKTQLKVKKKTWYTIFTHRVFGESFLGEIPLIDSTAMKGRSITSNLMNLTNNPKNQNINLTFKIVRVDGAKGIAYPAKYSMIASTIRRVVRRRKDKVADSFVVKTADGIKVRIKPMIITRFQTNKSTCTIIRKAANDFLRKAVSGSNYLTLFLDIVGYRLQRALRENIKKTFPVAIVEIRELEALATEDLLAASEEPKRAQELVYEPKPREQKPIREETGREGIAEAAQTAPEQAEVQEEPSDAQPENPEAGESAGGAASEAVPEADAAAKPKKKSPKKKKSEQAADQPADQ